MNTGLVPGTILFAFLFVFGIGLLTLTSSHRVSLLIFAAVGLEERQWRRAQLHQLYFARPRPGGVPAHRPRMAPPLGNEAIPAAPDASAPG
ncbi:MAG: hypothetical protein ACHP8B_10120 [Terriglobales bacterium]